MDNLIPYFKIAEEEAKKSPCTRRKYGAVIVYPGTEILHVSAHNSRIGQCCNSFCIRERLNMAHNGSVEVGAEIHSEAAVLLSRPETGGKGLFILVGFDGKSGKQLTGDKVYPCHSCSVLLKYTGFDFIYQRNKAKEIYPVSISEVLDYREKLWENQ